MEEVLKYEGKLKVVGIVEGQSVGLPDGLGERQIKNDFFIV